MNCLGSSGLGENGPESSVEALKEADDRIQTLFNNCFEEWPVQILWPAITTGALFGVNGLHISATRW